MRLSLKEFFLRAPVWVKRVFCNAEAIRRDYYRKYGDYGRLYAEIDFDSVMRSYPRERQQEQIKELIRLCAASVPFYRGLAPDTPLASLPFLTKRDMIERSGDIVAEGLQKKYCFPGTTSGSTGTPVRYLIDREAVRLNKIYQEKFYEHVKITPKDRMVRFSGVNIKPFYDKRPPFAVYIDKYRQLQCSTYHLSEETFESYLDSMMRYRVTYGTGYAKAWLFLAEYLLKHEKTPPRLKVIITDSEGIDGVQQETVERVFGCPVRQTYGLSELGQIAVCCQYGHYHIIPSLCYCEIADENLAPVPNGTSGQIILTALASAKTPFLRYVTGDLGILHEIPCPCGWNTQYLTDIEGRVDDYVLSPDGRKIGRLSHLLKPAVGVAASQIIQKSPEEIEILIIPGRDFDESAMKDVMQNAQHYIGDIRLSWRLTQELRRTSNGKIKYVIREN